MPSTARVSRGGAPKLRLALVVISALSARCALGDAVTSCSALDAECVLASARGTPAWVAQYSVAADGPEQFHVNYGATPDAAAIRWTTANASATASVRWGTSSNALNHSVLGRTDRYVYSSKYTSPWIHTANVTGLPLATRIFYSVGDAATGLSPVMSFMSNPGIGAIYPYRTAFVADIGEAESANTTVTRVLEAAALGLVDSVVINGDISYATGCEADGCTTWDAYCRMASPLASSVPWQITIGNHEEADSANFIYAISSTYRFAGMPTGGRSDAGTGLRYYSWEAGPVHYVSIDSFYDLYGPLQPITKWVEADLAAIDYARTPWVVVSLHAPWYNSNKDHQLEGEPARLGLEQIFIKAGVSAIFSGHVHAYERSQPVAAYKVVPPGPGSIVHFNVGDAGAGLYTRWNDPQPEWSAFRNATWGHGRWVVLNATHSEWTWHRNDASTTESQDTYVLANANPRVW